MFSNTSEYGTLENVQLPGRFSDEKSASKSSSFAKKCIVGLGVTAGLYMVANGSNSIGSDSFLQGDFTNWPTCIANWLNCLWRYPIFIASCKCCDWSGRAHDLECIDFMPATCNSINYFCWCDYLDESHRFAKRHAWLNDHLSKYDQDKADKFHKMLKEHHKDHSTMRGSDKKQHKKNRKDNMVEKLEKLSLKFETTACNGSVLHLIGWWLWELFYSCPGCDANCGVGASAMNEMETIGTGLSTAKKSMSQGMSSMVYGLAEAADSIGGGVLGMFSTGAKNAVNQELAYDIAIKKVLACKQCMHCTFYPGGESDICNLSSVNPK